MAAELGLAFGKVAGDRESRVLVAEFSRSATRAAPDGGQIRLGVAARLVVRVSGLKAGMNLTLPFVAAEAQFNRLEASAALHVEGYVGPEAGPLLPNFGAFDVESYVKLMDSLTALKNQISNTPEHIRPTALWTWIPTASDEAKLEVQLASAVGTVWALTCMERGWPVARAFGEYRVVGDEPAHDAIRKTYQTVLGDSQDEPSEVVRSKAREWLDGYALKTDFF